MRTHLACAAAAACLLGGCSHAIRPPVAAAGRGSTDYRSAAHSDLAHYALAIGEVATGATPQTHTPPTYPPAELAQCLPQVELPARVIVDAQGNVAEVRLTPAPGQQPFAAAVRQAVRQWHYTPLTITRWAADAQGESHPVDTEAKPFSLDYVFGFHCAHGHAQVSTAPAASAR